jgi:hypothetical protein
MSSNLFTFLLLAAIISLPVAVIGAALSYARHCRVRPQPERRFPVIAYVLILLGCAVAGYFSAMVFGIDLACVRYPSGNLCGLFGVFASGPLGASLAVLFVAALILLLPPNVETVGAGTGWRPFSAPLKLWRGQYSLAASFWGFFVIGTFVFGSVNVAVTLLVPVLRPVLVCFYLGYEIVAAVAVWRSANAFVAAKGGRSSLTYADLAKIVSAKIVVVLWSLWWISNLLIALRWYIAK